MLKDHNALTPVRLEPVAPCCYISWFHLLWYATWPWSEKFEFWHIDPYFRWGGSAGEIIATMLLYFVIPLNLICNMATFWINWILTYWHHLLGGGGGGMGVCGQNICYHVNAFLIPFNLIFNMTMYWKSWTLTYWPQSPGSGGGGCLRAKYLIPC